METITPADLTEFEEALEVLEEAVGQLEEGDTEGLSYIWQQAKALEEGAKDAAAAPIAPLKAQITAAEKATRPTRKRLEVFTQETAAILDHVYAEVASVYEEAAAEAILAGNHAALADIPDAPPLAEGVTFAELKAAIVTDRSQIPAQYLMVDEKALLADLKAGVEVPGAELAVKRSWRRAAAKKGEQ